MTKREYLPMPRAKFEFAAARDVPVERLAFLFLSQLPPSEATPFALQRSAVQLRDALVSTRFAAEAVLGLPDHLNNISR